MYPCQAAVWRAFNNIAQNKQNVNIGKHTKSEIFFNNRIMFKNTILLHMYDSYILVYAYSQIYNIYVYSNWDDGYYFFRHRLQIQNENIHKLFIKYYKLFMLTEYVKKSW